MLKSHLYLGDHVVSVVIRSPILLSGALVYREQREANRCVMC